MLAAGARPLPGRRRPRRDGALQLQDGDRADRVDLDHLRRHLGLHRADPGQHLHATRRCRAPSRSRTPTSRSCSTRRARTPPAVWNSILEHGGSVQHLDFLSQDEKDVFKTGFEIDQRWLLELAADRTPYIDQAQSLNLFIPADVDKWDLLMLHWPAWERGSSRSTTCAPSRCSAPASPAARGATAGRHARSSGKTDYEECLACQ